MAEDMNALPPIPTEIAILPLFNTTVYPMTVLPLAVGLLGVLVVTVAPEGGFGVFAVFPLAIGFGAQTRDLVSSPDIDGVSPVFVVGALVVQAMWWSWAFLVGDLSILIFATVIGLGCALNVALWLLRRSGRLRPRAHPQVAEAA